MAAGNTNFEKVEQTVGHFGSYISNNKPKNQFCGLKRSNFNILNPTFFAPYPIWFPNREAQSVMTEETRSGWDLKHFLADQ